MFSDFAEAVSQVIGIILGVALITAILCGVLAEYDENGNMQMRICVWYKPLNMKGDTDNPDKMLYSLIFCEVCKNGGECSKHKYSEPFEEGWYVWSQKGYCG